MIIDCKSISENLKEQYKTYISSLDKKPHLAVIIVGENPASQVYVRNKEKACKHVGIQTETISLDSSIKEWELINLIKELNDDKSVNGILVQLPLPKHLDENKICNSINPSKDVDGFTDFNTSKLWKKDIGLIPCTPKGIIEVLNSINFDFTGKKAVVLGRSQIVGLPIAKLLLDNNCTVTICHSKSNIEEACQNADLIVSAIGKPKFITKDMFSPTDLSKMTLIDVGINKDENGKLCGDFDFENLKDNVANITKVPGGIGLMTVTMLLENTIEAYQIQNIIC